MLYKKNPNNYTRCEKCKHIDREKEECKVTNDKWLVSDRAGTCHQFEGVNMKVKCLNQMLTLTKDRVYDVLGEEGNCFLIENDIGLKDKYIRVIFEIVEDEIKNPKQVAANKAIKPNHYKAVKFDVITQEMYHLYKLKNKNYGNSFSLSYEEYGLTMVCIRLEDKLRRLKSLNKQGENANADDESIRDTLIDLANYSVMAIMELDKERVKTND